MKKITQHLALIGVGVLVLVSVAHAQLFTYTTTSTTSSTVITTTTATTTTTTFVPNPEAAAVVAPSAIFVPSGFIEFNGLVLDNVSSSSMLAGITAATTCVSYLTADATVGTPVACPITASSSYAINITPSTQLLFSDRQPASLYNFLPGDTVNVFGLYGSDAMVQAYIARDLSNSAVVTTIASSSGELATLQDIAQTIQLLAVEANADSSTFASTGEASDVIAAITDLQNIIFELSGSSTIQY